jgi:hypothetical protein
MKKKKLTSNTKLTVESEDGMGRRGPHLAAAAGPEAASEDTPKICSMSNPAASAVKNSRRRRGARPLTTPLGELVVGQVRRAAE